MRLAKHQKKAFSEPELSRQKKAFSEAPELSRQKKAFSEAPELSRQGASRTLPAYPPPPYRNLPPAAKPKSWA